MAFFSDATFETQSCYNKNSLFTLLYDLLVLKRTYYEMLAFAKFWGLSRPCRPQKNESFRRSPYFVIRVLRRIRASRLPISPGRSYLSLILDELPKFLPICDSPGHWRILILAPTVVIWISTKIHDLSTLALTNGIHF